MLPIPSLKAVDVGSESLSATLCPTKAFSEYLVETILAFVEALGHNVVMLHSDQEPVLVQLLKAVQSRRVKRTLVRHGPRASHQSQGKIENANRVINGVCRAMWLSLENLLQEKLPSDSILIAWLIRHAAWSLTIFQVKNDGRTAFVRVFGKAYTSQVLPFGERVMYKYTAVPTGNLDQRWGHGIWVGKAPMTDEHIILTENGVQKARSLHRVPPEERFVISESVEESARTSLERQGGKLESDDCDATGPRPIWTSTCVLDDQGRGKAWCNAWLQWLCRFGSAHRSTVECDWKRHWLTGEQVQSERQSDRLLSLPLSPQQPAPVAQ